MRLVIQRVSEASVSIEGKLYAEIGQGLMILVGITPNDTEEDAKWLAQKVTALRVFDDLEGVMNKNVNEIHGNILIISQFTLMASYKKGNRPSYIKAARPEQAIPLYECFCNEMRTMITEGKVKTGVFGADMQVALINDGPVTICMDTKNKE